MMISSPKRVGLRTSTAASRITSTLLRWRRSPWAMCRTQFSTITTELSTTMEVDSPQAQEAGRDAELQHAGEREQHRQGDGQGDDGRRTQVAQEGEQDGDDQEAALEEVLANRVDDVIHEFRAVIND